MRVRAVVAGAVALVVLGPLASAASAMKPAGPLVLVTGNGPVTAEFRVERTVTFDLEEANIWGTGTYAGIKFMETRSSNPAWFSHVLGWRDATPDVAGTPYVFRVGGSGTGAREVTLRAGHWYRVYLLTDGLADVRFPVQRGVGLTLRPATPNVQRFQYGAVDLTSHTPGRAAARRTLLRGPDIYHIARGDFNSTLTVEPDVTLCFTRRNATCKTGEYGLRNAPGNISSGGRVSVSLADRRLSGTTRDARVEGAFQQSVRGELILVIMSFQIVR